MVGNQVGLKVAAQEQERERVCLDVHDGVVQTLVAAFQYLQTLEAGAPDDKNIKGLIDKATAQVKKAINARRWQHCHHSQR
jgi:signal transduction histidine kinase